MAKVTRFEDLTCWQEARKLSNFIYDIIEAKEMYKRYALSSQIERAGISVMNNIAEGFGRYSKKDFIKFLSIAASSCDEVKSMSYLMFDRNIISEKKLAEFHLLINQTVSKIMALVRYINNQLKEEESKK